MTLFLLIDTPLIQPLHPEQIITRNDYPVHNEHILKIYFRVFQAGFGATLPMVPVINKDLGIPFAVGDSQEVIEYNTSLQRYLDQNPHAEYFLLDGNHKTTAAALTGNGISCLVLKTDNDILYAQALLAKGEFFSLSINNTISENVDNLREHFFQTREFQTVSYKTRKMVRERVIPQYMIDYYDHFV